MAAQAVWQYSPIQPGNWWKTWAALPFHLQLRCFYPLFRRVSPWVSFRCSKANYPCKRVNNFLLFQFIASLQHKGRMWLHGKKSHQNWGFSPLWHVPITITAQLLFPNTYSLLSALPLRVSFLDTWMTMREQDMSQKVGPLHPLFYTAHQSQFLHFFSPIKCF